MMKINPDSFKKKISKIATFWQCGNPERIGKHRLKASHSSRIFNGKDTEKCSSGLSKYMHKH